MLLNWSWVCQCEIMVHMYILLFSHSVVSDSLQPHRLQHTRLPCPLPLPELAQTPVHRVGDVIQPSHPLSSPSSPVFSCSQHQGLFQWVSSLHQVAKVLELQLQHWALQWIFRVDFLKDWPVGSPCCSRDSQEVFSRETAPHNRWTGQSIGASASTSVLPMNIQGWFP